jgi:2-dehydropantoate 2-reductase
MKICIFGAGAIGGYIGALLTLKGEAQVSLVARGAHLDAMKAQGLTLQMGSERFTVRPELTDVPAKLGPQDYILLTIKAHALPQIADALEPLIGPSTAIVYGQNGIPWWYFYRHGGSHDGRRLDSVDPGGVIWRKLGPERAIGAVIWQAAELKGPGAVVHKYGERMPLAEPSGEKSQRVVELSRFLSNAGIKSPVRPNLRPEIWLKLWGNLSFNPLSVLTGDTLAGMATDHSVLNVAKLMMTEAKNVAETLGITFPVSMEERIDMAAKVGEHRTSMLQDADAGRPTELDALLGSVIELGRITGVVTPTLELIYELTKARCRISALVSRVV